MNRRTGAFPRVQHFFLLLLISFLCHPAVPDDSSEEKLDSSRALEIARRWRKHLVPLQFWLKKSEGKEPSSSWISRERSEKRPFEIAGLAVDPVTIWLPDLKVETRFISRITASDSEIPARLNGNLLHAPGWVVVTEAPLAGVEKLKFLPADQIGPVSDLLALKSSFEKGAWTFSLGSLGRSFKIQGSSIWLRTRPGLFLLDSRGRPAGYTFSDLLPAQETPGLWRGVEIAPDPILTFDSLEKLKRLFEEKTLDLIPTVKVSFRREEEQDERPSFARRFFPSRLGGGDSALDDLLVSGFAVGPRQVLVHLSLVKVQAIRLQKVLVTVGGKERPAKFLGAFKNYGVFLVEVEGEDLPAHLNLSNRASYSLLQPLITVSADHTTGKRKNYVEFNRVTDYVKGYQNVIESVLSRFPRLGTLVYSAEDHKLLGAVVEVRRKDERTSFSRYRYYGRSYPYGGSLDLRVLTGEELQDLLKKAPEAFDSRLRPRSLEREKDLVWFGVEYQPFNKELARTRGVEVQTRGGEIGLLVLYVYPGSPAAKGNIRPGDILLSVRAMEEPEPFELQSDAGSSPQSFYESFPDELPEELQGQFFSRMPPPWRSQRNFLNSKLTEIGEGTEVELRYLQEGEEKTHSFRLDIGPPSFGNAPKEKLEELGLTVKDLTFEVRTHYRLKDDAPGVVVSKVERGSKAAVAKIFPYETITSVNGEFVRSAKQFREKVEKNLKEGGSGTGKALELKLERLGKSRLVKIRL